jgi:proline iminopeptidase
MWRKHTLTTADGELLWRHKGAGRLIVFLHGGPGDEHRYLRPLADPLTSHYRCLLYDQRGSGGPTLQRLDEVTLHPDRFVEDLEQLRLELRVDKLNLVGHSWGATLALLYAGAHPDRVERQALIGLGPLNAEFAAVAKANLMKPLSPQEREEYARLSEERRTAIQAGDASRLAAINHRRSSLGFRGVFYAQENLAEFVENWLEYEPYRNWFVNQEVNRLLDRQKIWDRLSEIPAPTLVMYGYQDFEPITQAYILQARMPEVQLCFINQCGHLPWMEQPDAVRTALFNFFSAGK